MKKSIRKWFPAIFGLLLLVVAIVFWPKDQPDDPTLPAMVDFNYHIRPILSQNCFVCHGPDSSTREAGVRLDTYEFATAKLENGGAAIVPHSSGKSLLMKRISSHEPDFQMPPPEVKKTLTDREIALLERWIDQGAKWKPYWAFIPPEKPELPQTLAKAYPSQVIDYLVEAELLAKDLAPSEKANKHTLIRRVSYLLTGLPPSKDDVQNFIADNSDDAYEKMVDQYLSSPYFGERWARHWMDLVRYAEHKGHEFDYTITGAWQYRDYLIRAFNQDVPYDLFVKEHLAGDLLPEPRYHPEEDFNESIIGTGYFFLGEGKHSPVSVKLEESDQIDNVIDVTSKTFQALTVACARCHDHKFDPIPTTDYYAMYGMMESARIGPLPARKSKMQTQVINRLKKIKSTIRAQLAEQITLETNQVTPQFVSQLQEFVDQKDDPEESQKDIKEYIVLGDFRQGDWNGWHTTGWAFGEGPMMGNPLFDQQARLKGLATGVASSRYYSSGVMGALRSKNFIIQHDSIAIRAAGLNSTIRIIVDNFQLIQDPLYGSLEQWVNDPSWSNYVLDVSMLKGHKAYLEFMPGSYGDNRERAPQHLYRINPEDYIEIQYAIAYDNELPDMKIPRPEKLASSPVEVKQQAIDAWTNNQASTKQIYFLQNRLAELKNHSNAITPLLQEYDQLAGQLYDSTNFLGLSEGDAVFSPVFIRGNFNQLSKEKVPRKFLTAVDSSGSELTQEGSGRLAWAEAVVDPKNPLTARVIANRIWHHLFGRGIVETVDNFGMQGKLPSHPALLDYLALRMVENGWSMKGLMKDIIMSEAFQRSTSAITENQQLDPENIMLHHFPLRRLEAEAIRDGMLAVSGNLDLNMYGPPVPIHLTEFMTGRGRPKTSGPLDGAGRRSLYLAVRRNFISPMMLVFDTPIPFSTFGKRNTTNVPAQSLTLMNDPFVHQQAYYFAKDLLEKDGQSIPQRVEDIYMQAFSRPPTNQELIEAEALLEDLAKEQEGSLAELKNDEQIWADFCHSIFNLKEFIHLL